MASSSSVNPIFIDTNLGTHMAMAVSPHITVAELKREIASEHWMCFPLTGKIRVSGLMVKRKSFLYHLPDSMPIKSAFHGLKGVWFLHMHVNNVVKLRDINTYNGSHVADSENPENLITCLDKKEKNTKKKRRGRKDKCFEGDVLNGSKEKLISAPAEAPCDPWGLTIETPSVSLSEEVSVTGILTRYFPEFDKVESVDTDGESGAIDACQDQLYPKSGSNEEFSKILVHHTPEVKTRTSSLADENREASRVKLGRTEIGKRLVLAANDFWTSASKRRMTLSACQSKDAHLLSSLVRNIGFEISVFGAMAPTPDSIKPRGDLSFMIVLFNYDLYVLDLIRSSGLYQADVCIVGVARTPMGGFLGSLSSIPATKLGSIAIECALKRANVDPSLVQEVFFGNVLSANLGQAPARQAALGAGITNSVVCTTVNKVCASGMKATMLASQSIQLGLNDIVVAGGMESMSNAPKYLAEARKGSRLGHDTLIDGMLKDGLWDVYNDYGMGVCAELCADNHTVTREEQDAYAIQSFERGIAARDSGAFTWEITPVEVSGGRGRPSTIVGKDDGLDKFDPAKLKKLRPSFKESGGSVTAGNASSISDGAAALVLVSGAKAIELGLEVIAKISGYADAAQAPELFTTAPALAIPKAISNAGLEASQVDYYEINEAFAVVALANQKILGIKPEKINVHGGAVSLGHPLGCSGARILVTLLGVLRQRNGKYGVGGVCNGGGGASALVVELV
ncbi:hypothetical protein GIB67_001022 [Kingdonia uniflora]|uniref:Uncharacterized protein n=1 Tax=Kingdonia uniflora TaxID=39325 RepID=A0A7J7MFU4_9MAGN|nr:hypothetical protein GIB67_001022 [Kingdonia uniflora]